MVVVDILSTGSMFWGLLLWEFSRNMIVTVIDAVLISVQKPLFLFYLFSDIVSGMTKH